MRELYAFCQRIVNLIMPFATKVMQVFSATPNQLYEEASTLGRVGFYSNMLILRGLGIADVSMLEIMLVAGVGIWVIVSVLSYFTNIVS